MNILIAGGTGNLGSHLTRHLIHTSHRLRILVHKRPPSVDVSAQSNLSTIQGDLEHPATLTKACEGIDCVVHLAGVLFRPRPETFLYKTNTLYLKNLADAAISTRVKKYILVSFPHVEGESTPQNPAKGILDAHPVGIHGQTRLEAEKYLLQICKNGQMTAVTLRAGVIYGKGVKLIEVAQWLLKRRLLAIWKKPTWLHLVSLPDLLTLLEVAIEKEGIQGIYNLCDDEPLYLQEFLDQLAEHWGYPKPFRLPAVSFYLAACLCEFYAILFKTAAPLNHDIIQMGMTSVVADTSRMKAELMPKLIFPSFKKGLALL